MGDCSNAGYVQGSKGAFTMPIDIVCVGPTAERSVVMDGLRRGNIHLQDADPEDFAGAGSGGGATGNNHVAPNDMDRKLEGLFDGQCVACDIIFLILNASILTNHLPSQPFAEILDPGAPQKMMDPHPEVLSRLFPHQKVGLSFPTASSPRCS